MKKSALQIAKAIIHDDRSFIIGNVAEYMIQEVDSNDNNFYQYLTDEEIAEMNGNLEKTQRLGEEVYAMLRENFNYDISEFENMKTTKNLTHETKGNDRLYILWDHVKDEDGEILDPYEEVQDYIDQVLEGTDFNIIENDESVASFCNYDNCIITGIDKEQ